MKKGDYQTHEKAKNYDEKRFSGGLALVNIDELQLLRNFLVYSDKHNQTIADLGTGTGRFIGEILGINPKKIYTVDLSEFMLKILSNNYAKEIKKGIVKPLIASAENTSLPAKSIDVVTGFHLFKHLPNPTKTVIEAKRILKPKGFLIFDALNKNSIIRFNMGSCYALSEEGIKRILNKNDFKVIKIEYLHSLGETVYKIPGSLPKRVIHFFDKLISSSPMKIGTKMFVLAQKT